MDLESATDISKNPGTANSSNLTPALRALSDQLMRDPEEAKAARRQQMTKVRDEINRRRALLSDDDDDIAPSRKSA